MATREKATVVKKVKNGALMSDGSIRVSNVRWSFPNVVEPYVNTDDDGKKTKRYKIVGMLPKDTHSAVKKLIEDRIEELLKENKVRAIPDDKKFLKDGDKEAREEYEGFWIVSASEKTRPVLRRWDDDSGKSVLADDEDDDLDSLFYGGAWGSIWVNPWFQNHKKYGKRVNANLRAVMFKRHDEAFGQGRISDDDVDEAFDEDDDDDGGRPARKSSGGKRNRYEDDDEEDDRPRRRRRARDDEDDDPDDI